MFFCTVLDARSARQRPCQTRRMSVTATFQYYVQWRNGIGSVCLSLAFWGEAESVLPQENDTLGMAMYTKYYVVLFSWLSQTLESLVFCSGTGSYYVDFFVPSWLCPFFGLAGVLLGLSSVAGRPLHRMAAKFFGACCDSKDHLKRCRWSRHHERECGLKQDREASEASHHERGASC